ncbi:MAG TPA: HAMP domain-containing sensor histidine kinase [Arenimonas sp.]|nr:HAMP domain-containing sensor histidine kinase [Arenimonas sp.]
MPRPRFRRSLIAYLGSVLVLAPLLAVPLALWLQTRLEDPWLAGSMSLLATLPVTLWLLRRRLQPMLRMFQALAGTALSFRDGDFSFGLAWPRRDELDELVQAHNALGQTLREQRLALTQRELLLDTMVQNTPVAMLLLSESATGDGSDGLRPVVFANLAARRLLGGGRRLEGRTLEHILADAAAPLREALERGGDGLFSVGDSDDEQVYHLARRRFRLNGRGHELLLLRTLTAELRRQEVQTWKKVIRVISHELNNSLAPIASLAHSGSELLRRSQHERLPEVFATIEERARHLEGFIRGYAHFAKLPQPRRQRMEWSEFVRRLHSQIAFAAEGPLPEAPAHLDLPQVEQALINLLKNAHESGSPAESVQLRIRAQDGGVRIEVLDRGGGMSEAVLANALVPFYSTKRSGTGLGLALAREIAEAHGGRIALRNRRNGGLCVSLLLPN